jgi:hypothetical protein
MKKRILLVLLTLVLALALVIPMAIPVAAQGVTTLNLTVVQGYEIFAGIVNGTNRYGATFVAQVAGYDNDHITMYTGALTVSTNYAGTAPVPGKYNNLIGGSWTLTLVQKGKTVGTIIGQINSSGGLVDWFPKAASGVTPGTDYGNVYAPVTFMGISKTFAGKTGYGLFQGQDVHASGVYLFGIEVPTVNGKLSLTFK